jgi:hypothetical protein
MIYMTGTHDETGEEFILMVLEPGNLEKLADGFPLRTPDGKILVACVNDLPWLASKVVLTGGKISRIVDLIQEAWERPHNPSPGKDTTLADPKDFKRFLLDDKQ